jgi:hypothetical protein
MRRPILVPMLAAALAAGLAVSQARAGVDVQIPLKAKAKGTILPEGEIETFRFAATAGTVVAVSVKAARGADLDLALEILDPDGDPIVLGPDVLTDTGTKLRVKGLTLETTGTWTLRLSAEGTGAYSLTFTAKPQAKFSGTLALPGSGMLPFDFSAPAGSDVLLVAKAAQGSAASPRFGMLTGTDYALDLSDEGKRTGTSHAVMAHDVGGKGDLSVEVTNASAAGGDVDVSVKVRPAKARPLKLDLRGASLGEPGGGETVLARVIDSAGGTVTVEDPESDLDGAGVDIPPDAFEEPTLVTIQSSPTIVPATDDDHQASGPSIFLGPSGTVFGEAVTVTLPFDLSQVPADADPQDLQVLVQEDDGSSRVVNPSAVDEEAGTVTVQTTTFSICVPISVPGVARIGLAPGGDQYWAMLMEYRMDTDPGDDSRSRQFRLELGEGALFADGTFTASLDARTIQYSDGSDSSTFNSGANAEYPSGTWSYGADGQTILLDAGGDHSPTLTVTRDARYAVGRGNSPSDTGVHLDLFVRKHGEPMTLASLNGSYHFLAVELGFNPSGAGSPMGIKVSREIGTLILDGQGGVQGSAAGRKMEFDQFTGDYSNRSEGGGGTGSYTIEGDGTVLLTFDPDEVGDSPDVLRVYPAEGLDVMFGADKDPCGDCVFVFALVRQSSDFSASDVSGDYVFKALEVEPSSYGIESPFTGDVGLHDESVAITFSGGGTFTGQGDQHKVRRDTGVAGGVSVENGVDSLNASWSVDRKGKLVISVPGETGAPVGGVAPAGDVGALVTNVSTNDETFNFGFFVRPPPPKN